MSASLIPNADAAAQGKGPGLAAVLMVLFLAATDGTVMATLLPTIADKLGEPELYPWLMSGFLLPLALIAPLSGALADRFGASRVLVAGILLFLFASAAAALSPSLPWLIAARVSQGAGAGMIIVLSYTLLAILYGPEERGRMQGILSGVWGLAAIFGPLVGAVLNATLGWRWIFWINLPVGVLGLILLSRTTASGKGRSGASIDPKVQTLFAVAVFGVLLTLSDTSRSAASHLGLAAGLAALLAFLTLYIKVRRAPEHSPVPVGFFQQRELSAVIALVLLSSAGLYASVTLLPFCMHENRGRNTLSIGFFVMVAALGWVVSSAICGNALKKYGYRQPALLGALMLVAGACGLALTAVAGGTTSIALSELLIGLGLGAVATTTLVLCQNAAPPFHIGSYTSTVQLLRNLGAAVGVNALAAVQFYGGSGADSFATSFTVLACLLALGLPLALLLPGNYDLRRTDLPKPIGSSQ
jgi:MFS family permease